MQSAGQNRPARSSGRLNSLNFPNRSRGFLIRARSMNYFKLIMLNSLLRLIHRIGFKSQLDRLHCPKCKARTFMIDSFLYFYLECFPDSRPALLKLDPELCDTVIICRHCGREIAIQDANIDLLKRIVSSGAQWIRI